MYPRNNDLNSNEFQNNSSYTIYVCSLQLNGTHFLINTKFSRIQLESKLPKIEEASDNHERTSSKVQTSFELLTKQAAAILYMA